MGDLSSANWFDEVENCKYDGLGSLLPLGGEGEMKWNRLLRLILYLMGLGWTFLGVGVISDIFMVAIEKITSSKKRVMNNKTGRMITVYVWNATVANLTLMALGSSAPEILLSLIEITGDNFFMGPLGAGTIVGSAAFNLLVISAVCVCAIPDGEVRYIKETVVYAITATSSVAAYLWLIFILMVTSPDVCEIWEGILTLLFCPLLVIAAYLADRGYFSKKKAEDAEQPEDHVLAIAEDASEEELAEVEAEIRERHGANLSQEQIVKLMKVEYCGRHTRAWYRHQAMSERLHGKHVDNTPIGTPETAVQAVINTSDDISEEQKKMVIIGAESDKYAYLENVGKAKVGICRLGPTDCKAFVKYKTREGTAKCPSDYDHVEGTLTFEKGETSKEIFIPIKDDTSFENDESFFVDLSEPRTEESAGCRARLWETHTTVEVTIIDDDMPGELSFTTEEVEVVEGTADQTVNVAVQRKNGATGKIKCTFKTEDMQGAVAGADYEAAKGEVELADGQQTANVAVVVKSRGRANKGTFNVVLEEPEGCKFDPKTDGGEEQCICHITIKSGADKADMFKQMKERVNSANAMMGHKNWAQQFKDALFEVGDGDDEEEEGDEPAGPKEGPAKLDIFIHVLTVPWKLLFAFVPPVDYCGGWACFCGSLCMIAIVTAIVGDMANLVGCSFGILPETAAVTFVALGTSLPDTFASQTAAKMDPYADASIGNITGSNSVNVFLGVGIAWTLAAFYWQTSKPSDEWIKRLMKMDSGVVDNVRKMVPDANSNAVFVTPAGTIWFNLMVFCLNAFCALQHLFARRKKWGGELGGPKKGVMGQYFSGGFLIAQWCIYIIASIIFARTQSPLTYQGIAEASGD